MNGDLLWYIMLLALSFLFGLDAGVAGKRAAKKSRRKVVPVAMVLSCLASCLASPALLVAPVSAEGTNNIGLPNYELYAPAKVVVSFVYTKNVTIEVSTLKTSLYKAITSPVQLEFDTEDVDVYTVTMHILYGVKVNQTIVIGIFEGDRPAKSMEFDVVSSSITVTMKLSVVKEPTYPTAEEISNLMWVKWQNELATFESKQNDLVTGISNTVVTVGSLAAIAFAVTVALILVVFRMHQKVAELSEWGIRHRTEHRREEGGYE